MSSRGARLLSAGPNNRVEPLVTYRRLPPDDASSSEAGRIEPHFTAVRVDRRGRPVGAGQGEGIEALPLVEAPPSDASIDPLAEVSAGEIREVLRPRGPRIAALAGVLAVVLGAGVLAVTYGGIAKLDASPEPSAVVPASGEATQVAGLESEAGTDPGRSVRVVAAYPMASASETAALAPRAAADPVAGGAAPSDQATVSGEAALFAEPPGRVIVDPPLPRLRPATASFHPAQAPAPSVVPAPGVTTTVVSTAPAVAPVDAAGPDIDSALANVDRILDEQRATVMMDGSGDGEFYGPAAPSVPVDPYAQAYPGQAYPAQPVYPPQPAYPVTGQPVYPATGVVVMQPYGPPYPYRGAATPDSNVIAEAVPPSPWWLPQRRAVGVDNPPIPPADIPTGTVGGVW